MKWYWLSVIVVIVLASTVAGYLIYQDYAARKADAGQKAMMLAQALAEQTTQIVASLDAMSNAVVQDVTDKIVSDAFLSEVLKRRAHAETDAVIGIALLNEKGRVTASGISTIPVGTDLAHSAEFKALLRSDVVSVFFNHLKNHHIVTPRSCVGQTMTYSRAIYDAQNRFKGVILILINEHYLYNFYDRFEKDPDIALGLVGADGVIRASNNKLAIGHNIKTYIEHELASGQGIQVRSSPIVNYRLIFAYYKSSAAPLWAYAGFPMAPLRVAWLKAASIIIIALLALFSVMAVCGVLLRKYLASQQELLKRDIDTLKEKQEREIFQTIAGASGLVRFRTH